MSNWFTFTSLSVSNPTGSQLDRSPPSKDSSPILVQMSMPGYAHVPALPASMLQSAVLIIYVQQSSLLSVADCRTNHFVLLEDTSHGENLQSLQPANSQKC